MQSSRLQQEPQPVRAEQSPKLLPDTVGSLAGSCLLQSQGEGGAWAFVLPLGSQRSAGVLGCL